MIFNVLHLSNNLKLKLMKTKNFWDNGINPITMQREYYWYYQFLDENIGPPKSDDVDQRIYNKLKSIEEKEKKVKVKLTPKQKYDLINGKS